MVYKIDYVDGDDLIPDGRFAIRDRGKHLIVIAGQSLQWKQVCY
ncbi:hypothetical protein [Haladaptatus sp. DYF46]|nr:hypothetical protein [Haladaptatus sp. DYF46]